MERATLDTLLHKIHSSPASGKTKLVAIDGRGGSGKSSLTKELIKYDSTLKVLQVDAFPCRPDEHPFHSSGTQTQVNWQRLRDEALLPLLQGCTAIYMRTSWWAPLEETLEEVASGGTVLVEGCYSLRQELISFYDLKIWVNSDEQESIRRAISRDGLNMKEIWEEIYAPSETHYISTHHPKKIADIVVGLDLEGAIKVL